MKIFKHLSPAGKWVLLVDMIFFGLILWGTVVVIKVASIVSNQ